MIWVGYGDGYDVTRPTSPDTAAAVGMMTGYADLGGVKPAECGIFDGLQD